MMKKNNYKLILISKKDNNLIMTIECYDKKVKDNLIKQLNKTKKYFNIKESE